MTSAPGIHGGPFRVELDTVCADCPHNATWHGMRTGRGPGECLYPDLDGQNCPCRAFVAPRPVAPVALPGPRLPDAADDRDIYLAFCQVVRAVIDDLLPDNTDVMVSEQTRERVYGVLMQTINTWHARNLPAQPAAQPGQTDRPARGDLDEPPA